MLFVFFISSAAGVLLGGVVGDRSAGTGSSGFPSWGPCPLTMLLPYADLFWTGVLTVGINLIMASAFASIMICAMDLVPKRIGLIGGDVLRAQLHAIGGIAAAFLGGLTDRIGMKASTRYVRSYRLRGFLAVFLPRLEGRR